MSEAVIFSVGGVLFIVTTWATIAFAIARVIPREEESGVDRNDVDSLLPPSES